MTKTAGISMRVDPSIKNEAESLFNSFGLSLTDAINVFLHKAIQVGGMPFELRQPKYNTETEEAIQESKDIMQGKIKAKSYASVEEMIADI